MVKIETVQATPNLVRKLRDNLREGDIKEIERYGLTVQKAVWDSYRTSMVRKIALADGEVACMWGVSGNCMGMIGIPWLLTASIVEKHPLAFVLYYREEVKNMLKLFPVLENIVDADYSQAIKLMELVGFTVSEPQAMGKHGKMFRKFRKVANARN